MAAVDVERLTEQQRRAVTARDVSVALSAGAGCGKTFVLTERFLRELDPSGENQGGRAPLGELIAITFTERAARQMRERIRTACRERLLSTGSDQVEYWLELIRELDAARISTIHSFCGTLLRRHAVEARLDPHFQILEQAQADTLLNELVDDELRSCLAGQDEAMIELVVEFGLETLRGMVTGLLGRRQEIEWRHWRAMTADELVDKWHDFWRTTTLPSVLKGVARSPHARAVLAIIDAHQPDHPVMLERCAVLTERLAALPGSNDPAGDLEIIHQNARVTSGGGKKSWPSEDVYQQFRQAAEGLRKAIETARPLLAFSKESAGRAAEVSLHVLALAEGVADTYQAAKQAAASLDFNDLLIHTRQLLASAENEPLCRRLASQTRLLLIDEFQDTDPLQAALAETLVGEGLAHGKLFLVGDYKQSIYRFRGADPHVFQRLRRELPAEGHLPLTLNFRSQPAILNFVNALFCDDLGPGYEPLVPHRQQVGPEPAVELLWVPDELPKQRCGQSERLRRGEADWIARRLRAMLDGGETLVWDSAAAKQGEPAARRVEPGDVAVLFRALSDVQYYEEALRRYEIDYYLVGGHAFYAQQEVYDVLNLLRSLASPADEVSLAGVLRSPMFSLEDETLFWLARNSGGLATGLSADSPPAELSADQRSRVEFAAGVLSRLRQVKDRLPIAALIDLALELTGYDAIVLVEFLGERKLANLRKLVDRARQMDNAGIFSLADFITQLSQFVARQPDEPLAATQPETTDVVRLMTIHQAKGLEFPVVVVPDLERPTRGSTASVAFSPELGPAVKVPSSAGGFELYAQVEKEEDQAELVRLLYVATTRAADYLILSSGVVEPGLAKGPWASLVGRRFDLLSGRLRVDLPDGYDRPNVKVTTTRPPLSAEPSSGGSPRNLDKLAEEAVELAQRGAGRIPDKLAPVATDRRARRQYSFSRLSGALHPHPGGRLATNLGEADPAGDTGERLDPLGLGTLVHAVLAEIELDWPDDVETWVRRLGPQHLGDGDVNFGEPIEMISRFLASPRAAEISAAAEVHRELEFLLAWPTPGSEEAPRTTPRYLEGFIDCLYKDSNGRWHLVDYKTNQVTAATLEQVAEEYRMQMLVYALAVERIVGAPPAELVLAMLRPRLEYQFPWDDTARRRTVEMVNQAIEAIVKMPECKMKTAN